MSTPSLLHVTVLTGPPMETQVRVYDERSWDSDTVSRPVMCKGIIHKFKTNEQEAYNNDKHMHPCIHSIMLCHVNTMHSMRNTEDENEYALAHHFDL